MVDGIGPVLSREHSIELALITFVGEIVLIVWLLVRGRRISFASEVASTET